MNRCIHGEVTCSLSIPTPRQNVGRVMPACERGHVVWRVVRGALSVRFPSSLCCRGLSQEVFKLS